MWAPSKPIPAGPVPAPVAKVPGLVGSLSHRSVANCWGVIFSPDFTWPNVCPPSFEAFAAVALLRRNAPECRPSSRSAFSFGTSTLEFTASGARPDFAFSDSGVPAVFDRIVVAVAVLDLPRMNVPPVAAIAEPDIATTSATTDTPSAPRPRPR
ncbi:unannotated protein [freshwater metagenome]|uniref:Unannotated protein n=1 Tax=freshwater metagenome TaxID=449393 RepID=A0A6J7L740_9ZZZZ